MGEIDLRSAARVIVDDAGGFIHRLLDHFQVRAGGVDMGLGGAENEEGELTAHHIGRIEHGMDLGIAQRELGIQGGDAK